MRDNFKEIDIKNIFVWNLNPRFESAGNIDFQNITINYEDDWEQIWHLLKNESRGYEVENVEDERDEDDHGEKNYQDFYLLCKSIIQNGFSSNEDTVFVKSVCNKEDAYAVLEGNRRISAIKILRKWNDYSTKEKLAKIFGETFVKKIEFEIKNKNWNINEFVTNTNKIYVKTIDVDTDNNEIWSIIYARHNTKKIGKSKWFRLKFLQDVKYHFQRLLKEYPNLNEENFVNDYFKEIKSALQTILNKGNIENDLKSSLWVTKSLENFSKNISNFDKIKISSFEISLNTIVDPENTTKKLSNYFIISQDYFNWENRLEIKILNVKYSITHLTDFLLTNKYVEDNYTTRGWKKEKISILRNFLYPNLVEVDKKNNWRNFTIDELKEKIKNKDFNENNFDGFESLNTLINSVTDLKERAPNFKNILFSLKTKIYERILLHKNETDNKFSSFRLLYGLIDSLIHESINDGELEQSIDLFPFSKLSLIARSTLEKIFLIFIVNDDSRNFLIKQEMFDSKVVSRGTLIIDFNNATEIPNFHNSIANYRKNKFISANMKITSSLQKKKNVSDLSIAFSKLITSFRLTNEKELISFSKTDLEINNDLKSIKIFNDVWGDGDLQDPDTIKWFYGKYTSFLSMMIHWDIYDLWIFEVADVEYINNWLLLIKNFIISLIELITYLNDIIKPLKLEV